MPEKVVIGSAELWHGDCREVLPLLPKHDLLLTDPPYGIGRDGKPPSTSSHGGHKGYEFMGWDADAPPGWLHVYADHFPTLLWLKSDLTVKHVNGGKLKFQIIERMSDTAKIQGMEIGDYRIDESCSSSLNTRYLTPILQCRVRQ